MHSRIYELKLSADNENILDEDEISIETLNFFSIDWLTTPDESRSNSIDWLCKTKGISYNEETSEIRFDDKKIMENDYKNFIDNAKKLSGISLDEFCGHSKDYKNSISYLKYYLDEAFEDRWGFYVYLEGNGLMPLNYFLRNYDTSVPYYVGNILDYHA